MHPPAVLNQTDATPPREQSAVALDLLATAVVLIDRSQRLQTINQAAETLLDTSAGRSLGGPLDEVLVTDGELESLLAQALTDNYPVVRREISLALRSGNRCAVDLTISPVQHGDQRALLLEMNPVDRLQRISEGENLWESQATLRAVVKGLAHEVKNPLGGIRGAAQLLSRELTDPELTEYTDVIMQEADRLRALVDRLLGPRERLDIAPMNIHEVTERVRQLTEVEAGPAVVWHRDYDPSLPEFRADRAQLTQALLNIVRNAWQAVGDRGDIILRTRARRQYTLGGRRHRLVCAVEVIDNGPGIPEELLPQLFLPMVSSRANGTGLGLSIAQAIANRHGGLVQCQSQPGRTCFTLLLPMED